MSNHQVQAIMYSEPVHYYEDGQWKDIDNTLSLEEAKSENDFDGYTNTQSDFSVKIAESSTEDQLIKMEKDKYKLSFQLNNQEESLVKNKQQAVIKEKEKTDYQSICENSNIVYDKAFEVNTVSDSVVYEDIAEDTDLEYKVTGSGLKENIIVHSKQDEYTYIFDIVAENLKLELKNNEIKAMDSKTGEVVYVVPAPYMSDANNEISTEVIYELEETDNGYQLKVQANKDWINGDGITFPVTIDPAITTETTKAAIDSTFISSNQPSTNFNDYLMLMIGKDTNAYGACRTLVKFDLPELNQGDIIVSAHLNLLQYYVNSYTENNPDMPIEAYTINSSWKPTTVTWDGMPEIDSSKVLDYSYLCKDDEKGTKSFDTTKAVKNWYDGETENNGIMLKAETETGNYSEIAINARYWSEKYNAETDAYPMISLVYRNTKGLEDYYSYTDFQIGSTGVAYVNDYTGNLYFAQSGVATSGVKMPATVYLTYNTSNSTSSVKGAKPECGYGWKLNIQQFIASSKEYGLTGTAYETYPYVYTDEDGTEHYFMKVEGEDGKVTYEDEDGLGYELSVNSAGQYEIKDGSDNKMIFMSNGYLLSMEDSNGNKMTIQYDDTNTMIQSVIDGAGKVIKVGNKSSVLSTLTDPAGRVTKFEIDSTLTKVTEPDGLVSTYTYDEENGLTTVTDPEGYQLKFNYLSATKGKRVSKVEEFSVDDSGNKATGQTMGFDYAEYNTTKITTSGVDNKYGTKDDVITICQFDNYGRLVSSGAKSNGEQLGTSLTKYTAGKANSTGSNIKKLNKVSSGVDVGKNVDNLLKNHNMEQSRDWQLLKTGTCSESTGYSSTYKYMGNQSLMISVSDATSGCNARYRQMLTNDVVVPGKTYTFSGYIKTAGLSPLEEGTYGAALVVYCYYEDGSTKAFYSDYTSSSSDTAINDGWRKQSVTFTVPETATKTSVNLMLKETNGSAYFDAVQLEEGKTANTYNFLENASFEDSTELNAYGTKNLTLSSSNDEMVESCVEGTKGIKIVGEKDKQKWIYQEVKVSGTEADTYVVSGWAKAYAAPAYFEDGSSDKNRRFKISVKVTYSDGTYVWKDAAEFTPDVIGWQYSAVTFDLSDGDDSTTKTPTSITIYPRYDYQVNEVIFDQLSVTKEAVSAYSYDSNGNMISAQSSANQTSNMEYTDNNLTSYTDANGEESNYVYDDKNNLTEETTSTGMKYKYTYNDAGNVTKEITKNKSSSSVDMQIVTEKTYTENGAFIKTESDEDGYVTTYDYDLNKGTLKSLTDAKGNTATYQYKEENDLLTKVSETVGGETVSNTYDYDKSTLNKITHNGFSFLFDYDSFGNNTKIKVGDTTLLTNEFNSNNGYLKKKTYGNGDSLEFTYDVYGNISSMSENGTVAYKWYTDNTGNVTKHEDLKNKLQYNYVYDSTGRLYQQSAIDTTKSQTAEKNVYFLEYGYDLNNNVTKFVNKAGSKTLKNTYAYTADDLLSVYSMPTGRKVSYSYDSLNRLTKYSIGTDTAVNVNYDYVLSARNGSGETTYRTATINTETIGDSSCKFTYDKLGNIIKIRRKNTEGIYEEICSYEYDESSQLTRENNLDENKTKVYTYDIGGNITSINEYDYTTGSLGEVKNTIEYEYGDSNWKDKLTSYNGTEIKYDEIGNPTSYRGYTFDWSNGRELTSLSGNDTTATYTYNADGVRTTKTVNGVTTTYEYLDNKLVYEKKGEIELHYMYDISGSLKGIKYIKADGTELNYYVATNWRGDVVSIYNGAGELRAAYTYDTWGNVLSVKDQNGAEITSGTHIGTLNSIRYRSYYYDEEIGMYYLQSRYYDPVTCRFINADDTGVLSVEQDSIHQYNMFAYCLNNPVNMSDDGGDFGTPIQWAFAAVGAIAGVVVGGAVIGWFTGKLMTNLLTKFCNANRRICEKIPNAVKKFLGLKNTCFVAGTLVSAEDGNVPIEEIEIGDYVWAENPETGEKDLKKSSQYF